MECTSFVFQLLLLEVSVTMFGTVSTHTEDFDFGSFEDKFDKGVTGSRIRTSPTSNKLNGKMKIKRFWRC